MVDIAYDRWEYRNLYYMERFGFRQVPKEDRPTNYRSHICHVRHLFGPQVTYQQTNLWGFTYNMRDNIDGSLTIASNRAFAKLVEKAREVESSYGALIAQYNEAADMIFKRAKQLLDLVRGFFSRSARKTAKALRALSKGLPKTGGKRLPSPKELARASADKASQWWLEYWFGWSPMVADIQNAVEVLASHPPYVPLKEGSGKGAMRTYRFMDKHPSTGTVQRFVYQDLKVEGVVQVGCKVRCDNPNAYLARSLGLTDLPGIAWEVVPYSWLVNWFVDVAGWLDQWTWAFGLEIKDPYTTHMVWGKLDRNQGGSQYPAGASSYESFAQRRQKILPQVKLRWNPPDRLAVTRAASAVSLLTQFLLNPRKTA